jgi:hypothetical protein
MTDDPSPGTAFLDRCARAEAAAHKRKARADRPRDGWHLRDFVGRRQVWVHGEFTGTGRQEIVTGQPNRGLWRYLVNVDGRPVADGWAGFLGVAMAAAEMERRADDGDKLPPEIIVLPAERFGPEWRFNLATGVYADRDGGPFEGGYTEAEFRETLAAQGYDQAAISVAVVEAIEAGKLLSPEMDDEEWRQLQEDNAKVPRPPLDDLDLDTDIPF